MKITKDSSTELMSEVRERDGWVDPFRFAFGIARKDAEGTLLDFRPVVDSREGNYGTAALAAYVMGLDALDSGTHEMTPSQVDHLLVLLEPWVGDGEPHPNIEGLESLRREFGPPPADRLPLFYTDVMALVVCLEEDAELSIVDAPQAIFALTLLSRRDDRPHEINLDGIFGKLHNVAWTNYGPVQLADVPMARRSLPGFMVTHVDKFPRMVDYVIPTGVRIADADRVRLGAYLAEGTTVMHEGFVNFNAGTLGQSMVEGRISANVVVGARSDIGGGASLMGTLSGGNATVISVGEDCLLEAESGLGIPVGDRVRVEAGFYLKSTTKVKINGRDVALMENPVIMEAIKGIRPAGADSIRWVNAASLTGIKDVIFRRNSISGEAEVISRGDHVWGELNPMLHAN